MKKTFISFLKNESGQGMTEYGLVMGILSIAAIVAITSLRAEIVQMVQQVTNAVASRDLNS